MIQPHTTSAWDSEERSTRRASRSGDRRQRSRPEGDAQGLRLRQVGDAAVGRERADGYGGHLGS